MILHAIHLQHCTIRLVGEIVPLLLPLGEEGSRPFGVKASARVAFGWEAEPVKPLQRGTLRPWLWIAKELICEEGEPPFCGDARILLS